MKEIVTYSVKCVQELTRGKVTEQAKRRMTFANREEALDFSKKVTGHCICVEKTSLNKIVELLDSIKENGLLYLVLGELISSELRYENPEKRASYYDKTREYLLACDYTEKLDDKDKKMVKDAFNVVEKEFLEDFGN